MKVISLPILDMKLDRAHFSDDYLSQQIHELYDYSIKLSQYGALKEKYPGFFTNLPLHTQMKLETFAETGPALTELLTKHMDLHGIVIESGNPFLWIHSGSNLPRSPQKHPALQKAPRMILAD